MLSLATAPIGELQAALEAELREPAPDADQGARAAGALPAGIVPGRAIQIARLIVAETVRLIRLGTQPEVLDAGEAAARLIVQPAVRQLSESDPETYRLLSAASVALGAAMAPSSRGGEVAVLRSWNGKARVALVHLLRAPQTRMPRATLRELLGVTESYLSHLLSDLESAGLIVRARSGREVTVRIGPIAHSDHVKEMVAGTDGGQAPGWQERQAVVDTFESILQAELGADADGTETLEGLEDLEGLEGIDRLRRELAEIRRKAQMLEFEVEPPLLDGPRAVCKVEISCRPRGAWHDARRRSSMRLIWEARVQDGVVVAVDSWLARQRRRRAPGSAILANRRQSEPDVAGVAFLRAGSMYFDLDLQMIHNNIAPGEAYQSTGSWETIVSAQTDDAENSGKLGASAIVRLGERIAFTPQSAERLDGPLRGLDPPRRLHPAE